jgi:cytochrome oxidase Cu insertion factor (SCO1/SenC/PrrC family)
MQRAQLRAPPPLASLGAWTLTSQDGAAVSDVTMHGKVWMVSFFFSRCPTVCPKQQADFSRMLGQVDDLIGKAGVAPIEAVSITVDPAYDTPAVLAAYRAKSAVAGPWTLLTGDIKAISDLVEGKMKMAVGDTTEKNGLIDISHANRFALVDQNGDLRGIWPSDDEGRGNLVNAARLLAKLGPNP